MDRFAALRASPLLREFSDVGVRILADACEERSVGKGALAFRAGEPSEALCFVGRGTLHIVARDGGSPIGELFPGATVGNLSLLAPGEHLVTGLATTDVELAVLRREAFEALRKEKPQATLKLLLAVA